MSAPLARSPIATLAQLQAHVRARFPDTSAQADRAFADHWDEAPTADAAYSWFGSLASVLNAEMNRAVDARLHAPLLHCIAEVLDGCSTSVFQCIDVSFVENLFWGVSANKSTPYWQLLPHALKALYLDFHGQSPQ